MAEAERQRSPRDYFYGEVLQLPPGTQRPDHYELLGVAYFEADHDIILRAALQRLRVLEACLADPRPAYRKVLRQLMAEVRDAQMTLLDATRREAYEAQLTGRQKRKAEAAEPPREHELPLGKMFAGRYRVMGIARRGALGFVHDALDSNLRTRVHLSVLAPHLSAQRVARRPIEHAARAAAALDHPGLLRIDEVGEADGMLFVRTRAPEGKNLLEAIEATPQMRMGADEARRVAGEIAQALGYAHAQGAVHGDLRPHNVFVDAGGRVLVADAKVARAFADAAQLPPSRYREPENEPTPRGDLFALGALLYQMLAGMPPYSSDARTEPIKELPADVPADLAAAVHRLLSTNPAQRPASAAEAAELLRPRERRPRRLLVLAGAATLLLAFVGGFLAFGGNDAPQRVNVKERAWQLIAEGRYGEAIESLRRARTDAPADASLLPPLAKALEGAAAEAGPWQAQQMLAEAQTLDPSSEREAAYAKARDEAVARLAAVEVTAPEVAPAADVTVRTGGVPLRRATVEGEAQEGGGDELHFAPRLPDGAHTLHWTLEDAAGNRRTGTLPVTVDTTPPEVTIEAPADGAQLRSGRVEVVARVADANPPRTVDVGGEEAWLEKGEAVRILELADGEHRIEVLARDRAGHETRAGVTVLVDTKVPDLHLDRERIVTQDGRAVVSGRLGSRVESLTVDGQPVPVAEDGTFERQVVVLTDRAVPVEAVGPTGIHSRTSVTIVVDREPPEVAAVWPRRGPAGELRYGAREMDAGTVDVPLDVKDECAVTFTPDRGTVEGRVWRIPAQEGTHAATLVARDEAGNEARLDLALDGHRAAPRLEVKCTTDAFTRDDEARLDVEAEGELTIGGKPAEPGRITVPLPEGRVTLEARAEDAYGNASVWQREVVVDRTPPGLELVGDPERGVGQQEIEFKADEPLASVTCFGRTFDVEGESVKVEAELRPGRRNVVVVARDRAGNTAKHSFPLTVVNRALVLDGKSSVRVDLPRDLKLDEFTLECWVRGFPPVGGQVVCSSYKDSGMALSWCTTKEPLPYAVVFGEVSARILLPAKKGWRWEEWTHLALTHDGKKVRFYVDGSLQGSADMKDWMRPGNSGLWIGADVGNHYGFRGAIDELRVSDVARYTRAFTPPRFHRPDEHTVLLLRFDVLRNGVHPDASGRGYDGHPVGSPELKEP